MDLLTASIPSLRLWAAQATLSGATSASTSQSQAAHLEAVRRLKSVGDIGRIWRAFGLQPQRSETFTLSRGPLFVDEVRDIAGPYLAPPHRACVADDVRPVRASHAPLSAPRSDVLVCRAGRASVH
jgi:hypothetical protein